MLEPNSYPPVITTSTDKPPPFLRLARETRFKIYRFLVSTKYTQRRASEHYGERFTLRYDYTYDLHTAILFTNRQIYYEASYIFYMENLFIRVNTVEYWSPSESGTQAPYLVTVHEPFRVPGDYGYPIFKGNKKVQDCMRHAMELELIPYSSPAGRRRDCHVILACDDLPLFCRALLWADAQSEGPPVLLRQMELRIIISDEILNPVSYKLPPEPLNAATSYAAADLEGSTKASRITVEENANTSKQVSDGGSTTVEGTTETKPKLLEMPSPVKATKVQRLLEPLRSLHSIKFSYIDAPISERYRHDIKTSLARRRPRVDDIFLPLLSAYQDAIATFEAGHFTMAIQKMKGVRDIVLDVSDLCHGHLSKKLRMEPFAELSRRRSLGRMHSSAAVYLTRAYLKFPDSLVFARAAQALARSIDLRAFGSNPDVHEMAMIRYLEAEAWEVLDQLGEHKGHPRSEVLQTVIEILDRALHQEPNNPMLQQELERRQKEKAVAKILEEVMEMEKDEGEVHRGERITFNKDS